LSPGYFLASSIFMGDESITDRRAGTTRSAASRFIYGNERTRVVLRLRELGTTTMKKK